MISSFTYMFLGVKNFAVLRTTYQNNGLCPKDKAHLFLGIIILPFDFIAGNEDNQD